MSTAAAHGLAVLCEKPIDLDIDTVLDCRERIKEHAVPIMLGFNRRFDPHFASIRTQVAAGAIGALEQLLITSRDPAPAPRDYIAASGGIFRDMTIHDLDMARFFLPNIVEVSAMGTNSFHDDTKALGDFDAATIILRGRDGEIVNITNSRHCAFGYDQRLEAFGSTGMLTAGNVAPTTVRRYGSNGTEEAPAYFPFFLERYAQAYRAELDAFASPSAPATHAHPDSTTVWPHSSSPTRPRNRLLLARPSPSPTDRPPSVIRPLVGRTMEHPEVAVRECPSMSRIATSISLHTLRGLRPSLCRPGPIDVELKLFSSGYLYRCDLDRSLR